MLALSTSSILLPTIIVPGCCGGLPRNMSNSSRSNKTHYSRLRFVLAPFERRFGCHSPIRIGSASGGPTKIMASPLLRQRSLVVSSPERIYDTSTAGKQPENTGFQITSSVGALNLSSSANAG